MATRNTNTKSSTASAAAEACGAEQLPSWKRTAIALIANVATTAGVAAAGVAISIALSNMAFYATASVFLALFIYYLGALLSIVLAGMSGFLVQNMIIDGGAAKAVSDRVNGAWGWATSKFGGTNSATVH